MTISNFFPQGESISTATRCNRHHFSTDGMPGNGSVNPTALMGKNAMDQRNIFLLDGPFFELPGKKLMGHIIFCHKQEPGSIFIEPVNNAGPEFSADARKIFAMFQKAVNQGAG